MVTVEEEEEQTSAADELPPEEISEEETGGPREVRAAETNAREIGKGTGEKKEENQSERTEVDVILGGMETFGSAERECDKDVMRTAFNTIMDGAYKAKLFELFGEERTMAELEEYLKLTFIPRVGCGIGVTRLIKSLVKEGLV